jgi:hypothetical protein
MHCLDGIPLGARIPLPSLRVPRNDELPFAVYSMARTTLPTGKFDPRVTRNVDGRESLDSIFRFIVGIILRVARVRVRASCGRGVADQRDEHYLCNGKSTAGETHLKTWSRSHRHHS